MPARQGDLNLLAEPVAQTLLQSALPARLAYTWRDGTPRMLQRLYLAKLERLAHSARLRAAPPSAP